jgi:hypothetical protein
MGPGSFPTSLHISQLWNGASVYLIRLLYKLNNVSRLFNKMPGKQYMLNQYYGNQFSDVEAKGQSFKTFVWDYSEWW